MELAVAGQARGAAGQGPRMSLPRSAAASGAQTEGLVWAVVGRAAGSEQLREDSGMKSLTLSHRFLSWPPRPPSTCLHIPSRLVIYTVSMEMGGVESPRRGEAR